MKLKKLKHRIRYYYMATVMLLGYCPKCYHRLSYTSAGRGICTVCGGR